MPRLRIHLAIDAVLRRASLLESFDFAQDSTLSFCRRVEFDCPAFLLNRRQGKAAEAEKSELVLREKRGQVDLGPALIVGQIYPPLKLGRDSYHLV